MSAWSTQMTCRLPELDHSREAAGCKIHGSRQKVIVFGAIAADGRPLFGTYDRFDQDVYQVPWGTAPPVRQDCSHHGCAPQHTGARVRRYIKENHDIRAIALPVATPELNATEYRHQLKQDVTVSTHYEDADTWVMQSEFTRTYRHRLDIMRFIPRESLLPKIIWSAVYTLTTQDCTSLLR